MDLSIRRNKLHKIKKMIAFPFIVVIAICLIGCVATVPVVAKYIANQGKYTTTLEVGKTAEEIYHIVIQAIEERPDIKLLKKDEENLFIEASKEKQTTTIKASPVSETRSRVVITADAGDSWEGSKELSSRIVMRICESVQMDCQLILE